MKIKVREKIDYICLTLDLLLFVLIMVYIRPLFVVPIIFAFFDIFTIDKEK